MSYQETKTELINTEKIKEMKFYKKNFSSLQDLTIVQSQQINSMIEQLNVGSEINRKIKNLLILKEEKINLLNAEIKYLKLKVNIEKSIG
jgi:hypothetical protein